MFRDDPIADPGQLASVSETPPPIAQVPEGESLFVSGYCVKLSVVDESKLDPNEYCTCGVCTEMKTVRESFCCIPKYKHLTGKLNLNLKWLCHKSNPIMLN